MDWMTFLPPLLIYGLALTFMTIIHKRKYNALNKKYKGLQAHLDALNKKYKGLQAHLAELKEKSHLEQDLSLATTEQLMEQVQSRVPGFILITPNASNVQDEQGLNVHIKGLPPQAAISCMKFACQVIATNAPPQQGFFGGHGEYDGE